MPVPLRGGCSPRIDDPESRVTGARPAHVARRPAVGDEKPSPISSRIQAGLLTYAPGYPLMAQAFSLASPNDWVTRITVAEAGMPSASNLPGLDEAHAVGGGRPPLAPRGLCRAQVEAA